MGLVRLVRKNCVCVEMIALLRVLVVVVYLIVSFDSESSCTPLTLSLPYSGARYLNDNHLTSIESGAFTGLTSIYWLYELSTTFCSFIMYIFCVTTQFRCYRVLSSNRISTIASSALSEISSIYWLYVSDSGCRAYVT
jgi:hypothetical protein